MLGQFLEYGISAGSIGAAFEHYRALGFQSVPTGDIIDHSYAVVSDGDVCLGLHEHEAPSPVLTFVRPELKTYIRALRRRNIELQFTRLADEEFHEAGFLDPNGQWVTLIEARTFSRTDPHMQKTVCGEFLELSAPTDSLAESQDYWEAFGLIQVAAGNAPHPWIRLQGHGLTIGFHEHARFICGPCFSSPNLDARTEYLRAKGFEIRDAAPQGVVGTRSATLIGPDSIPIFLLEEAPS